jgi:acetylornithine deacetylase
VSAVADLLAQLVAMPTHQLAPDGTRGNERALCDLVAPMLRARGADEVVVVDVPRSDGSPGAYVFARWGTPVRVINAHVDTVPPNTGWSRSPWDVHRDATHLYGLGSCDTKAAIAATLIALEQLGAAPKDRGVLFSGDEEAGNAIMPVFLASPHAKGIREVIVCEPTARGAGIAHRGVLAQHAVLTGPGGHSSKADHLQRPIAKLARFAAALDGLGRARLNDGPTGMTGLCLNLAGIAGGVAFNVIPARGELTWSLRPYPAGVAADGSPVAGFDRAAWNHEIRALAAAIDPAIEVGTDVDHPPFAASGDLAALVAPFVERTGSLDFWTEAAMIAERGIHAVVIGPGDIGHAHSPDERVPLADLDWAVSLFRALLG